MKLLSLILILLKLIFCSTSYSKVNTEVHKEIKILSWNIFMIPKPFNFTKQKERTPLIAKYIREINADLVVLEECFDEDVRAFMKDNLKDIYPYMAELGKSKKFYQFLTSGIFILSKFPMKTLAEVFYNDCNTTDCFGSKGFLLTEVKITNEIIIQLGGTHLQAWDSDTSKSTRLSQMNQLSETLKSFKQKNIPQILAGDFNIDLQTEERKNLFKIIDVFDPVTDPNITYTIGDPNDCFHVPGKGENKKWIDYILTVKSEKVATVTSTISKKLQGKIKKKTCDLSDHFAIESKVTL